MRRLVWTAFAIALLAGCGHKMPDTVPVAGKVTYGGGAWPSPGMLYFASTAAAEGRPMRPALAEMTTAGDFVVTSFEQGDGLVPGRYVVTIECWKTPPTMSGGAGISAVPAKYRNQGTSDFFVDVSPGGSSIDVKFDVPSTALGP